MNKKTKTIAIITGVILATVLIIWLFLKLGGSENQIGNQDIPEKYRDRVIVTEEIGDGLKTATNKFDGYRITVPSNWSVGETASFQEGLSIYSDPTDLEIEDLRGSLLNVLTMYDPTDAKKILPETAEFGETEINGKTIPRIIYNQLELDFNATPSPILVPIENSGSVAYVFSGDEKYYFVRCTVIGDENYIVLLSQCEKQIKTFEVID